MAGPADAQCAVCRSLFNVGSQVIILRCRVRTFISNFVLLEQLFIVTCGKHFSDWVAALEVIGVDWLLDFHVIHVLSF